MDYWFNVVRPKDPFLGCARTSWSTFLWILPTCPSTHTKFLLQYIFLLRSPSIFYSKYFHSPYYPSFLLFLFLLLGKNVFSPPSLFFPPFSILPLLFYWPIFPYICLLKKLLSLDYQGWSEYRTINNKKYYSCWVTSPPGPLSALLSSRLSVTWRTKVIKNSNLEKRSQETCPPPPLSRWWCLPYCSDSEMAIKHHWQWTWSGKSSPHYYSSSSSQWSRGKVTKFNSSTASRCSSDVRVPWGPLAFYWVVPALSSSFCSNFAKMLIWMLLCRLFNQVYY